MDDPAPQGAHDCLAACCALALEWLRGTNPREARKVLARSLAEMSQGATFGNARILLASSFGVESEVVSGSLERMLELSGARGLVLLGVNPRLLYPGASAGRHAVVLAACSRRPSSSWAGRQLDVAEAGPPARIAIIDAAETGAPRRRIDAALLAAAFDAAGREGLLIYPGNFA